VEVEAKSPDKEAVAVTTVARRDRGTFADLFDWLEAEFPALPVFRPFTGTQLMRVEDFHDDGHYVLRVELPGIDPDKDVDIAISDGVLTMKAERREEKKEGRRSEFHYGTFRRSMTLPAGADEDDIKATYADGILEVRIGIGSTERPEPKHISVLKG
jgi:HSP20 family protein